MPSPNSVLAVATLSGQSLFHAFDPSDRAFSMNLVAWKGRLVAVSTLRRADPALLEAVSPYEAFKRGDEKEACFEFVRVQQFPMLPSRLGCLFLFLSREDADACNAKWWKGARVIVEGRIQSAQSAGIFDSRHLDTAADQWEAAARRYWTGDLMADPRREVLVDGEVQLVDWEQHARLGP